MKYDKLNENVYLDKSIKLDEYEEDENAKSFSTSDNLELEKEIKNFFRKKYAAMSANINNYLKNSQLVIDNPIRFCLLVCN